MFVRVTLLFVTVRHYAKLRSKWSGLTEFRLNSPKLLLRLYTSSTSIEVFVIWFEHESLLCILYVCLSFLNIQMVTQFTPLSQNNWWNSSWKRISTTYGCVRVLLFYLTSITLILLKSFAIHSTRENSLGKRLIHFGIYFAHNRTNMLTYFPND